MNTSLLPHYCIIVAIGVVSLSMNLYVVARAMLLMKITAEMLIALLMIMVQFFYIGCANYIGQIVLDKGNDLFMKTYYARWHESPLPVQKMLLYMRQRSMKPTAFVIGALYTASFEFSSKVNVSQATVVQGRERTRRDLLLSASERIHVLFHGTLLYDLTFLLEGSFVTASCHVYTRYLL
ncbi:uncharacterized protein LOC143376006 [Andrena cerasifolii]|uniref:uncharacterized protein LOC143376006 n=1 Tax=Andrena cerasifolii TaxID=2819439 RepID=UPI0040383AE0